LNGLLQDFRYGLRTVARNPGFAAVAMMALALGIGANTAIFSVVNAVLVQPLQYADPDDLVMVWEHNRPRNRTDNVVGPANYLRWEERNSVFQEMAGMAETTWNLTGDGEPERVGVALATPSLFRILGTPVILGRTFVDEDQRSDDVVLIIEGLWRRRFGSDPEIIGKTLTIQGETRRIVGVVREGAALPDDVEVWTPMPFTDEHWSFRGRYMTVVARLADGITLDQAQAEMDTIAAQLETELPDWDAGWGVHIVPLRRQLTGELRPALLVLFGAVGFVLLIACANVASLLLARASGRKREMSIRGALGAGRGRLIQQMLAESLLLSIGAGALGVVFAYWGVDLLLTIAPAEVPGFASIELNSEVLLFTLMVSIATGLLFGLLPAVATSGSDLVEPLKEGGRSAGATSHRAGNLLVVAEVAIVLVLLIGAGLLGRSFVHLARVDPGFRPDNVLALNLSLPGARYGEPEQQRAFFGDAIRLIEAVPGVESAAAISFLPLDGAGAATSILVDDRPEPPTGEEPVADVRSVTRNYFRTMGIPLIRGRTFEEVDGPGSGDKVVINATMSDTFWPDENPIGKTIQMSWGEMLHAEVVGVVGDVKHGGLDTMPRSKLYWHHPQFVYSGMTLVVHTKADPIGLTSELKARIGELDRELPISNIRTMDQIVSESLRQPRFTTLLLSIFAVVALMLVAIGLFGLISYSTAQRTREIGVRVALGASRNGVFRMIVGRGLVLALAGVTVGLFGAVILTRFLESLLFDISTTDPATFAFIVPILLAIAGIASYVPARRAMNVDPMEALRYE
jgi:putative ABC transport system permease protein